MSNPSGPTSRMKPADGGRSHRRGREETPSRTESRCTDPEHEPATEIYAEPDPAPTEEPTRARERRFTAPSGFDAGSTQKIDTPADPATEVMSVATLRRRGRRGGHTEPMAQQMVAPQVIPPRGDAPKPPRRPAQLGLGGGADAGDRRAGGRRDTRHRAADPRSEPKVSQEDKVRSTIQNFDVAIQNGDLATLRSITCGTTRDSYVKYDERAWTETHARVAAAKRYPVVASIDQVVVNGDHAEANVTTFMAYAPQTRSTRSFDLQFRDDQWKICQAPARLATANLSPTERPGAPAQPRALAPTSANVIAGL